MNTNLKINLLKRNHSRIRFLKKLDMDTSLILMNTLKVFVRQIATNWQRCQIFSIYGDWEEEHSIECAFLLFVMNTTDEWKGFLNSTMSLNSIINSRNNCPISLSSYQTFAYLAFFFLDNCLFFSIYQHWQLYISWLVSLTKSDKKFDKKF